MPPIIKPGAGILFMKVGTHADEPIDAIFARKIKEIEDAGMAFWGYGGGTCHPTNVVQPFAKSFEEQNGTIYLCMEKMNSSHFAVTARAEEYSEDGFGWKPVPVGINVTGSRYAVVIKNLRMEEFDLPLSHTRVALGNRMGVAGSKYITGRVDKACLEVTDSALSDENEKGPAHIGLVADIVKPYAVFVRNLPK